MGHYASDVEQKDIDRFFEKVDKTDSCWNWNTTKRTGYGIFYYKRKIVSAHRFSYMLHHGVITEKVIRHKCDNRACVNPEHLEQGTYAQNMQDMVERDRHRGTLRNADVEEIRQMPMTWTIVADVASKYGVSEETARSVIDGTTFGHLPGARPLIKQKSRSKLTIEQIKEIKADLQNPYWGQVNDLAKKYNVTHSQISHIKSGYIHSDVLLDR